MQIKAQSWLVYLLGEFKKRKILFRQLYAAAGLLIVVSVLLFLVVSAINDKSLHQKKQQELALQQENNLSATAVSIPSTGGTDTAKMEISINETVNMPLRGDTVVGFGWQEHPIYKDWRYHTGIDIRAKGQQAVQAMLSGKVLNVYSDKHSGLTVVVESNDYKIYYSSLSAAEAREGSYIKQGETIGKTGTSLDEPSEHLHLAVKKKDKYIDPLSLF